MFTRCLAAILCNSYQCRCGADGANIRREHPHRSLHNVACTWFTIERQAASLSHKHRCDITTALSARRWPGRFSGAVESLPFTLVDVPATQNTHDLRHTVCSSTTRCPQVTNLVCEGLQRAPPWSREKALRRIPARRVSTHTPPPVLKTTITCHPPSSADHQCSGPVARGATASTVKALQRFLKSHCIVIIECGKPRVGRVKSALSLGSLSLILCAFLFRPPTFHRLSAVTRPITFALSSLRLISWASLSPRQSAT